MALSHLKVLDLTSNLSGPYCAMILADQGADVIKIERPNVGDDMRLTPPFINGESAPFMSANRNKRSVILDLKTDEGLADFKKLVVDADILIENFKPGTADRIGIGYKAMQLLNQGLIYCSISGFGQTGPYATRGGFDLISQAMTGLAAICGDEDGPPHRLPIRAKLHCMQPSIPPLEKNCILYQICLEDWVAMTFIIQNLKKMGGLNL